MLKIEKFTDVCMTGGMHYTPSHTNVCKFYNFQLTLSHSSSLRPGSGMQSRNMVGQLYLLLYFFYQAELFPDDKTRRPALP